MVDQLQMGSCAGRKFTTHRVRMLRLRAKSRAGGQESLGSLSGTGPRTGEDATGCRVKRVRMADG